MKTAIAILALAAALLLPVVAEAQVVVGSNDGYDLDYLTPKSYEIGGIDFDGAENFDTRVVLLVAGLQVGDNIQLPGDKVSAAVENLTARAIAKLDEYGGNSQDNTFLRELLMYLVHRRK